MSFPLNLCSLRPCGHLLSTSPFPVAKAMANKALGGVLPASRIPLKPWSLPPSLYKPLQDTKPPTSASETDSWTKGHLADEARGRSFGPRPLVSKSFTETATSSL